MLTPGQQQRLNQLDPVAKQVGLGTLLAGLQDGSGVEPDAGKWLKAWLVATGAPGGAFAWQNTLGRPVVVDHVLVQIDTANGAAATLSVGVSATRTFASNLIDGLDVNQTGAFDNLTSAGVGGRSCQVVPPNAWVTASQASGTLQAALRARLAIHLVALE